VVSGVRDKVKLSQLGLKEKKRFLYLFDFGDEWRFAVTLEKILDHKITQPKVVERKAGCLHNTRMTKIKGMRRGKTKLFWN
jgi:hypothetical protein